MSFTEKHLFGECFFFFFFGESKATGLRASIRPFRVGPLPIKTHLDVGYNYTLSVAESELASTATVDLTRVLNPVPSPENYFFVIRCIPQLYIYRIYYNTHFKYSAFSLVCRAIVRR